MSKYTDGYMPFMGYKTYFKIFGSPKSKKTPILILHGGPGSAHYYLLGLSELVKTGRQVIFYDQLGGGKSDHPLNEKIWSLELFVHELEELREFLRLEEIILYGHSWGGMLVAEYLCGSERSGIEKVIFASSMLSMPLYREEIDILKKDLPPETYKILKKHEKSGTTDSAEYQHAMNEYNARHIFRGDHFPAQLHDPPGSFGKVPYEKLWGVSEVYPNGSLKNWSRLEDLYKITIPTLVIAGQYDELTPAQAFATYNQLPDARLDIITAGSHWVHVEFPVQYLDAIKKFLD